MSKLKMPKGKRDHRFTLRLPKDLFKKLEKISEETYYSINLLIIEAIKKDLETK